MASIAGHGRQGDSLFEVHSDLSPFFISSPPAYLAVHPDPRYDYIATGAIVFDTSDPAAPRVLLLQRAASDSMPGQWEIPGGGCDDEDESILHAAARELNEETGLRAIHFRAQVGDGEFFTSRSGKKIRKFVFVVDVGTYNEGVKLDPNEHQQFLWATKEEIEAHTAGSVKLKFTTSALEQAVLASFSLSKVNAN